jgi:hypothetical protein
MAVVGTKQKGDLRVVEQLIHLRSKRYEMQKLVGVDEVETAIAVGYQICFWQRCLSERDETKGSVFS